MATAEQIALPCPFCGSPALLSQYNGTWEARCSSSFDECAGTDALAPVEMWNRRVSAVPTPPGGWQDISTAPKDGRTILTRAPATDDQFSDVCLAYWHKGRLVDLADNHLSLDSRFTRWCDVPPAPSEER